MQKLLIIGLFILSSAVSSFAGWGIVNGQQVWFGQSGHWAVEYPDDGGQVPDIIYRGEGESWSFPDLDEDGE